MTITDRDQIHRIPNRWISHILINHAQRRAPSRHIPSIRTVAQVLDALAIRLREPSRAHRRATEAYADDTRDQIAIAARISADTVGDALAVLDGAGWSRVIVRGSRNRGSCRALPIVAVMATLTADDLNGECPPMMFSDLNGAIGDLNGTTQDLNGITRDLNGECPIPPQVSSTHASARTLAAASNGGDVFAYPAHTDDTDAITRTIADPNSRAIFERMAKKLADRNAS